MELRRTFLYFALAILGVMLWHAWQHDYHAPVAASNASVTQAAAVHPADFAPTAYDSKTSPYQATPKTLAATIPQNKMISVQTDVINAQINLRGGDLVNMTLLKYTVSLQQKNNSVQLFNSDNSALYVAQSGLSVPDEKTTATPIMYTSTQSRYVLKDGANQLVVTLNGKTADGIAVQKT